MKHKTAASHFFGFHDFRETIVHVVAFFGGVVSDFPDMKDIPRLLESTGPVKPPGRGRALTPLEACLITRMLFKTAMSQTTLGHLFGVGQPRISEAVTEWAPRWYVDRSLLKTSCLLLAPITV